MRRTQRYSDDGPSTVTKLECNHEETPVTLKLREPTKQLACKLQVSVSKKKKKNPGKTEELFPLEGDKETCVILNWIVPL